jgi:hypothetical protein
MGIYRLESDSEAQGVATVPGQLSVMQSEGRPVYRQLATSPGSKPYYLYFHTRESQGMWLIGPAGPGTGVLSLPWAFGNAQNALQTAVLMVRVETSSLGAESTDPWSPPRPEGDALAPVFGGGDRASGADGAGGFVWHALNPAAGWRKQRGLSAQCELEDAAPVVCALFEATEGGVGSQPSEMLAGAGCSCLTVRGAPKPATPSGEPSGVGSVEAALHPQEVAREAAAARGGVNGVYVVQVGHHSAGYTWYRWGITASEVGYHCIRHSAIARCELTHTNGPGAGARARPAPASPPRPAPDVQALRPHHERRRGGQDAVLPVVPAGAALLAHRAERRARGLLRAQVGRAAGAERSGDVALLAAADEDVAAGAHLPTRSFHCYNLAEPTHLPTCTPAHLPGRLPACPPARLQHPAMRAGCTLAPPPTVAPTGAPSAAPTAAPTGRPTPAPTLVPSTWPTPSPTQVPNT